MTFTDLAFDQDEDGIFDLVIEDGDFKLTEGFESALLVSLFSDRRAYLDEVPDPEKRRGWIGDLVAETPGDKIGSGLWFYEQSRLSVDDENGVRDEAEKSLDWAITDSWITLAQAQTAKTASKRSLKLNITLTMLDGGVSSYAFEVADATQRGAIVRQAFC